MDKIPANQSTNISELDCTSRIPNNQTNEVENQEQKEILEKATENQQTIINDVMHKKKVQTKTINSNKEKCKTEQKLKTLVRKKSVYECTVCDTKFNCASALSLHQICHYDSFKCKDCSMIFTKQSLLLEHSRLHTMKQSLECKDCNKTFISNSDLLRHNKIHTGERPYACDVCGKSFSQAIHMKIHYRIHTGERPYVCDVCGKSFTVKCSLIHHYRIHTGSKPFKCELCEKSFTQSQHLKGHIQRKHYKCL